MKPTDIGKKIEEKAAKFLESSGYKILDRNFKTRTGEIDIIALDGNTLVFVEVRFRKSHLFGTPEETVNLTKIKKIISTANRYISMKNPVYQDIRFDVIAVDLNGINHIKNAFDLDYM